MSIKVYWNYRHTLSIAIGFMITNFNIYNLFITTIIFIMFTDCSKSSNQNNSTLSQEEVSTLLKQLVKTPLPQKATNVFGHKVRAFTTIADIRFDCSETELNAFLIFSPVLVDTLIQRNRNIINTMSTKSWWQPDVLQYIHGSEQEWKVGTNKASCNILVGKIPKQQKMTVYLSITVE